MASTTQPRREGWEQTRWPQPVAAGWRASPSHRYAMHTPGTLTHPEASALIGLGGQYPVQVGLNHTTPAVLALTGWACTA